MKTKILLASLSLGALVLSLLPAPTVWADDWPQWRGPNRDGVWREDFSPGPPKVLWRAPVGPGWSSPVVAHGRVYLTDAQRARPKAKERVLCFEEGTGKPLWAFAYDVTYPDWAFTGGEGRGPTATPVVRDGKVYTLGNKGDLLCLDAAKGDVLWRRNLERDYRVQEFAFNASPLVEGDLLIACIGSYPGTLPSSVLALDKNTGKEVWKTPTEGLTNSSPVVLAAGGRRQLVVWTQGSVTSLDPATGKVLWRQRMKTAAQDAVATPVSHEARLLVSGLMLKLAPDRPAASVLWPDTKAATRRVLSNTCTPVLQGGCVFSARSSGELVCLAADTGEELWKTGTVTGLKQGAAIHLTPQGGGMFLYTDRGELIRAKLTARGYQEVSRFPLVEPVYPFAGRKVTWSPPAYADRRVFARSDRELVCASLAATP
ncbi:MAG TPA: PQQ-binding-like beta-propeller repeat protein [Gemmataceae bacterium]|nr:PQQ-binding-like beta-propeller repeat protein [Gemmataceae bacterium]